MSKLRAEKFPSYPNQALDSRKRNVSTQGQRKSLTWMDGFESR